MLKKIKHLSLILLLPLFMAVASTILLPLYASAAQQCGDGAKGNGQAYTPSIDLGCRGKGNPIMDATFGIIRFLSDGVGLVIVASTVYAGIQYASSRGDPNATAQAIKRIQSNAIALLIFIFGYAILNYVLPAGFLQ
jgi:hypothetical protein